MGPCREALVGGQKEGQGQTVSLSLPAGSLGLLCLVGQRWSPQVVVKWKG